MLTLKSLRSSEGETRDAPQSVWQHSDVRVCARARSYLRDEWIRAMDVVF